MIIAGRLVAEQIREHENNRWIRGSFMPVGRCVLLLDEVGPNGQRRLPFTITTTRPLPEGPIVAVGSLSEYEFPDGRLWYTLDITEYYKKNDPILEPFGTFQELCTRLANKDPEVIEALGDQKTKIREKLQKIFGTDNQFADRMIDRFGTSAYNRLKNNPWEMIHMIPYFTMKQADHAAEFFGIPLTDENRFREHFRSRIRLFFEDRKDTYMSAGDFYALYLMDFSGEMSKEEFIGKTIDCENPLVYQTELGIHPAQFYQDEKASMALIRKAGRMLIPETDEILQAEQKARETLDFILTPEQEDGFQNAFRSPIHFITGGPGTGKTTLLSAILKKLAILTHMNMKELDDSVSPVLMVSPTGKAAYRMWEQTGIRAYTAHSAFRIIPDYGCPDLEETAESLSHIHYLIIDESSMLDTHLFGEMARILMKMDHIPFILMVGDVDQLAPVGHGQVFKDLIEYAERVCPKCVTRLTILKRQENGSSIPELAVCLAKGSFPNEQWFDGRSDITFVNTDINTLSGILEHAVLAPKKGELDDVQIITPFRNGTMNDTIHALNKIAQPYYNPDPQGKTVTLNNPERSYQIGSRVINKKNRSEIVVNGSLGTITDMNTDSTDLFKWTVTVEFDSGAEIEYAYKELNELDLAYAITIHASQGSEYENVVLCIARGGTNAEFLNRNMIYTAVTRARKRLILMGSRNIFAMAAKTPAPVRKTALSQWLRQEAER